MRAWFQHADKRAATVPSPNHLANKGPRGKGSCIACRLSKRAREGFFARPYLGTHSSHVALLSLRATKCTSSLIFERTYAGWSDHITIKTTAHPARQSELTSKPLLLCVSLSHKHYEKANQNAVSQKASSRRKTVPCPAFSDKNRKRLVYLFFDLRLLLFPDLA